MHESLTCDEAYSLVIPYMLDTLGAEADVLIDAHLATCPDCRSYFDQIHEEYCARALQQLDQYVDRELSAEDMSYAETHLRACARCREQYAFYGQVLHHIQGRLAATPDETPAVNIMALFRERLRE